MNSKIAENTKKYRVASLFCGCGGLDLGFSGGFKFLENNYQKHQYEVVWSNDIDKNACLTYEKNFGKAPLCEDIDQVLSNPIYESLLPTNIDVVLGGFPCQDFSHAGKRNGLSVKRGQLYKSMVRFVDLVKPKIFVAENVKGILNIQNGEVPEIIKNDFESIGYEVSYKLYHAADFGVPQSRERVIFVGINKPLFKNSFTHIDKILNQSEWIPLEKTLQDLENLNEGEFPNHYWSKAKLFKGTQGNSIVSLDKIGPTMRAEHHGNIEFHWNNKRRLSAREAARIQSFPDDFIFHPSTSSAYKQIGNAVPPVFGWHIANSINAFLDKELI
jgi:DNA (cytosine-5)-methyltransferase 1